MNAHASIADVSTAWPQVIMIHGLMKSGKSTLADILIAQCGYRRVKFADTLKKMIRVILANAGISLELIEEYLEGTMKGTPIPELNDADRPHLLVQNLPDALIHDLVRVVLCETGMSDADVSTYMCDRFKPILEVGGCTTVDKLFQTLRADWSRGMLIGETVTVRRMMQTLGEEWRNLHSQKLWASIAAVATERLVQAGHRVVIDDNRYRFEFEPFAHLRYFRFVVTRGSRHFEPVAPGTHASEIPMPIHWFDAHLRNDSTVQALQDQASKFLSIAALYQTCLLTAAFESQSL